MTFKTFLNGIVAQLTVVIKVNLFPLRKTNFRFRLYFNQNYYLSKLRDQFSNTYDACRCNSLKKCFF